MPDLSTRTARRNLTPSPSKRWQRLARGRAVGYRRPGTEPGTWYVRTFTGDGYRMAALGTADDKADADGEQILDYGQATQLALRWDPTGDEAKRRDDLTVGDIVERYLEWFESHRKSHDRVQYVFRAHILPELGTVPLRALTAARLRRWHQALADSPARLRGGQKRPAATEDAKRARRVTANRSLTVLKAALNRAAEDGSIDEGTTPWAKVKPFRGVEAARVRYLEAQEVKRLVNAAETDLRNLILAAVHTGARYGELAALRVGDYLPEAGAIHLAKTKTGAPRHVYLSDDGVAFFDRLTAGRSTRDVLLKKAGSEPWGRNHQARPMRELCAVAKIDPPIGFHQLRHTYASLYLMAGGSLMALAKQLGHTTSRMVEKHYGHLADAWRSEEARKFAPKIGGSSGTGVRRIETGTIGKPKKPAPIGRSTVRSGR